MIMIFELIKYISNHKSIRNTRQINQFLKAIQLISSIPTNQNYYMLFALGRLSLTATTIVRMTNKYLE